MAGAPAEPRRSRVVLIAPMMSHCPVDPYKLDGLMHHGPGFAHLMDRDELNLIVDRIVNAIDTLGVDAVDSADRIVSRLRDLESALMDISSTIESHP